MGEEHGTGREIDWDTAEVQDGTLSVGLSGEADEAWSERVERVLDRLNPRGVESVEVEDDRLVVSGVQPGTEGDVRHLLESVVLQANADVAPDDDDEGGSDDERSDEDRQMTDAFRSFGDGDERDGEDD